MKVDLQVNPIETWAKTTHKPLIIAGPCSAETPEQLFATAKQLKELGKVDVLRAGIWKPRTRPNAFEGSGEEGLKWFADVKKELGMMIGTEVANPEHIELALKYGVDVLWIGARTTVSPFAIQEMADALQGVDIPVLIKNPTHPELGLWIGAFERFHRAGIKNLAAIHRGFSTIDKSKFRNVPTWSIPIELKRIAPQIPIICDPSHIGGKRDLIFDISQKAMDLGFDGLMIETHIDPDKAWSDADQQVTPARLGEILRDLKIREVTSDNQSFNDSLDDLRGKIDSLDRELIEVLTSRMAIVEKIGEFKKENNVTTLQVNRWDEIMKNLTSLAQKMNLSETYVEDLFKIIHEESIRKQTEIMKAIESKA
ncbi:MAG: bifunctional 3-deoxy-7-phosphoheptulonate synthase/chorismate mutase type II [Cytophagaceae bacterium]|nr:bifunctional 3-deoxy-7-phosphoheptulonate synthase/chorismate mutase type II [Cytophagaceae bacterium]